MRKLLLITVGGAVGYVLGARAGRPTYDRLVDNYASLRSGVGLDRAGRTVRDAGADLRDAVSEKASGAVNDAATSAANGIHEAADSIRDAGSPTTKHA
jgi:hypothetical protein